MRRGTSTVPVGARRRPTLVEVARLAGVSIATVSRVLNGTTPVSPPARDAVEAAIAELGYVPNRAARSLVTRRTDTIALVLSEPEARVFSDPFFAAVVEGILTAISESEQQLVLLLAKGEREQAKVERYVRQGHVDGVMLMSLHGDDPLPARLVSAGVPTVLVGRPPSPQPIPYVNADNRGGARAAAEHLLAAGRRTIATITGPLDMTVTVDRFEGYCDALKAAGVPFRSELIAAGDFTVGGAEEATRRLLERNPGLDAVFAASDPMAAGALHALRGAGLHIPEDVAVVGFDDAVIAASTEPPLTTVRQPLRDMTQALADLVLQLVNGIAPAEEHLIFETTLVRRGSS